MPTDFNTETKGRQPRLLLIATIAATVRGFLLPIARHFQAKGWRVDAMANGITSDEVCQSTFQQVWEADWGRNPARPQNLMVIDRIRELAAQQEYDIVHTHTPVASFVTRLALHRLRHDQHVQVLYTAHGFHFHPVGGVLRNTLFAALERKAGSWTDFLVVMNREDLRAAKEKRLVSPDRLKFMPGIGVDRSCYSNASVPAGEIDRLHRELGVSGETPLLLMLAEFTPRKRHEDALRAFSEVTHPGVHLLLAGGGPLLERTKLLAARLGIADRVHFLGPRRDVPVLIKASRALILPSSQEGLPRSIMEAMSMGVPVIGSRIRGTTELLERHAGLLVDVGDVHELARAMQTVLDDVDAAAAMGKTGQRQSEEYDVAHVLHLHEQLYGQALELRQQSMASSRNAA